MPIVTGTGFHGDGRAAVREAAEAAGAGYSGDLQKGTTTHLVVSDTAGVAASAKLQRAAEWGIPALQWSWLQQSAARGRLLPTGLYLYIGAEPSSAPAKPQAPPRQQRHSSSTANRLATRAANSTADAELSPSTGAAQKQPQPQQPTSFSATGRTANDSAACSDDAAGNGVDADQQEDGDQENTAPQQHPSQRCRAEPRQFSRAQNPSEANALAAELDGLQLSGSHDGDVAADSAFGADSIQSAAASQAGSCTEDEAVDCAQDPPALGDPGTPVPLPSPAQQRQSLTSMRASAAGTGSPQGVSAAGAPACSDFGTGSHGGPPSTVTSSSQGAWSSPVASAGRRMPLQPPAVPLPGLATPGRAAAGSGAVIALKVLARPPRGNTVAAFHGLARKQLQRIQFAEQAQVVGAGMVLSTRDRKVAVVLQPPPAAADDIDAPGGGGSRVAPPVLAELRSLYCMPSGDWWAEFSRLHTVDDIDDMAAASGQQIALPSGFDRRHELLRGIEYFHCPVAHVKEQKRLRHSKQVGPMKRNGDGGLFWRSCFDTELLRCVTDISVSQFVA